jgi:hypothetical protein
VLVIIKPGRVLMAKKRHRRSQSHSHPEHQGDTRTPESETTATTARHGVEIKAQEALLSARKRHTVDLVTGSDRVPRLRSIHQWMLDHQMIDQQRHDAAERYRDDYELAHGARGGEISAASVAGWERTPGQGQINAITRLRRANEVLGEDLEFLVAGVVRGDSLRSLVLRFGGPNGSGCTPTGLTVRKLGVRLAETLERLDVHYFGVRGGRAATQPRIGAERT